MTSAGPIGPNRGQRLAEAELRDVRGPELQLALGDVLGDRVAGDVIERVGGAHAAGAATDHHGELDLPVDRAGGDRDLVVRTRERGVQLREDQRVLRDVEAGLRGVRGVVETDAEDLPRRGGRRADQRVDELDVTGAVVAGGPLLHLRPAIERLGGRGRKPPIARALHVDAATVGAHERHAPGEVDEAHVRNRTRRSDIMHNV